MKKFVFALSFALVVCFLTSLAHATTIADWTFETSQPTTAGPISPETGAGAGSGSHAGTAAYSSPAGNGSSHSYSATNWAVGDNWQFSVTGDGATTYYINFDETSSNTGPRDFTLQYSTDGFVMDSHNVLSYSVPANAGSNGNNTWNATIVTTAAEFDGNSVTLGGPYSGILYFRMTDADTTSANGGTVAATGTSRIDNVVIADAPIPVVPEPATMVLCGLGFAGLMVAARFRKKV
jgi:PEP-CTERM motif